MHPVTYVVGLGNPDPKYDKTPHNIGRELVNWVARSKKAEWRAYKHFEVAAPGEYPVLVRLNSYMNLSGEAVREFLHKFSKDPTDLLICTDDFDLPLGTIRLRKKGSAGTHNGLKSIIQSLGTPEFPRLRIGVGPLPPGDDAARYVLATFPKEAQQRIPSVLELACQAFEAAYRFGLDAAMNEFNPKTAS